MYCIDLYVICFCIYIFTCLFAYNLFICLSIRLDCDIQKYICTHRCRYLIVVSTRIRIFILSYLSIYLYGKWYKYIHIYIYIYIYTYLYIYVCVCPCMYMSIPTLLHVFVHSFKHMFHCRSVHCMVHSFIFCACIPIHAYVHMCPPVCMCMSLSFKLC